MAVEERSIMDSLETWVPLCECIDGHLYSIDARNGSFGIFVKGDGIKHKYNNDAFILSRYKLGNNYIDQEFHWDTGEPHGTAKPIEDFGVAPKFENDKDMIKYLNELKHKIV